MERGVARRTGRAARQQLSGGRRIEAERLLTGHLLSLQSLASARSVGVFAAHDGEPDLTALVEHLWARGVTVALPHLGDEPEDKSMHYVQWARGSELTPGRYGIGVPGRGVPIEPEVVLVSLVGFDANGNRIGRGGGFFDRYLAGFDGRGIGVGFEAQRLAHVPTEPHDVGLGVIVTDLGVRFIHRPLR